MAAIISLGEKIQDVRRKKEALFKRRKLMTVLAFFQGDSVCERCRNELPAGRSTNRDVRVPYLFCGICAQEYISYIDRLQGKEDAELYWQNDSWMDVWKCWIDYQGSVDYYIQSKEFLQLQEENTLPESG